MRRGCMLSLDLFDIYSKDIVGDALEGFGGGVEFGGRGITSLGCADDAALVCSGEEELIDLLSRIGQAGEERDILLDTRKTKIMVVDRDDNDTDFAMPGNGIEVVNQFEYLGSIVSDRGGSTAEMGRRLAMARSTVQINSKGAVEGKRGRGRPPISWTDDRKCLDKE